MAVLGIGETGLIGTELVYQLDEHVDTVTVFTRGERAPTEYDTLPQECPCPGRCRTGVSHLQGGSNGIDARVTIG